jgi:hypothetical protein
MLIGLLKAPRRISFPNATKRFGFYENNSCVRNFSLSGSITSELAALREKRDQVMSKFLRDPSNAALQFQAKIYHDEIAILEEEREKS